MAIYRTEDEIKDSLFGTNNATVTPVQKPTINSVTPEVEINYVSNPTPVTEIPAEVVIEPIVSVAPVETIQEVKEAQPVVAPVEPTPVVSEPVKTEVVEEKKEEPVTETKNVESDEVIIKEKVDEALKIIKDEVKSEEESEEEKEEVIDVHSLKYLKKNDIDVDSGINILGDEETYISMLKDFHKNSKDIFGKLIEYKATKDTEKYAETAFSLKNNANYFGFVKLCEYAKDHELKAKAGDFDFINEHFKEYDDELMRIMDVLNTYFG